MTAATSGANPNGSTATGRPTRLPRSARRKQLLAAAQEVFVAQGYHAAAMDDIAERAGVSKPVLYQHFPGKLELYLALLDTHCDAIVERRSARRWRPPPTTRSGSAGAMQAYFDFVDHESEAFRLVFESDLRNEPAVRERVERVERGCVEAITDTIMADTGVSRARAELLAAGPVRRGRGRRALLARRRPPGRRRPRRRRSIAALSWRGIASFPLHGEPADDDGTLSAVDRASRSDADSAIG